MLLSFGAIGSISPFPSVSILDASILKFVTKTFLTDAERRFDEDGGPVNRHLAEPKDSSGPARQPVPHRQSPAKILSSFTTMNESLGHDGAHDGAGDDAAR